MAAILAPLGVPRRAASLAAEIALAVLIWPPTATTAGDAMSQMQEMSYYYRSAFIVASSQRLARGLREGKTLEELKIREQRYFRDHLNAMSNRRETAAQVDRMARRYGPTLGWYSVRDNRTSAECRDAHGKNFRVTDVPLIGFPGAVHIHCRCKAGPPHAGAVLLRAA